MATQETTSLKATETRAVEPGTVQPDKVIDVDAVVVNSEIQPFAQSRAGQGAAQEDDDDDGELAERLADSRLRALAEKKTLVERLELISRFLIETMERFGLKIQPGRDAEGLVTPEQHANREAQQAAWQEQAAQRLEFMDVERARREGVLAEKQQAYATATTEHKGVRQAMVMNGSVENLVAAQNEARQLAAALAASEKPLRDQMTAVAGQAENLQGMLEKQFQPPKIVQWIPVVGEWAKNRAKNKAEETFQGLSQRLANPDKYKGEVERFKTSETEAGRRVPAGVTTAADVYLLKLSRKGRAGVRDIVAQDARKYVTAVTTVYTAAVRSQDSAQEQRLLEFIRDPANPRHIAVSQDAENKYRQVAREGGLQDLLDLQQRAPGRGNLAQALKATQDLLTSKKTFKTPEVYAQMMNNLSDFTRQALRALEQGDLNSVGKMLSDPEFAKALGEDATRLAADSQRLGTDRSTLNTEIKERQGGLTLLNAGIRKFSEHLAGMLRLNEYDNSIRVVGKPEDVNDLLNSEAANVLSAPERPQGPVFVPVQQVQETFQRAVENRIGEAKNGINDIRQGLEGMYQAGMANAGR
jgi:hypothetical protein